MPERGSWIKNRRTTSRMDQEQVINQLKFAIQALALEAEGQIASFPDFVVVTDELLLEYDYWYKSATGNFPEFFSEKQIEILKEISLFTDRLPPENPNESIKEELRNSVFWKEMRELSKMALTLFNWDSEMPPEGRVIYVEG